MSDEQLAAVFLCALFGSVIGVPVGLYIVPPWYHWIRAKLWHCNCERCRAYRGET